MSKYQRPEERRLTMNIFYSSKFSHRSHIWMFHNRFLNNKINRLPGRCFRVVYNNNYWSYEQLPETVLQKCFSKKVFWKISRKFTGEHPWRNKISIKQLYNFIEIALRYGCSPVKLLDNFRTPFDHLRRATSELLNEDSFFRYIHEI